MIAGSGLGVWEWDIGTQVMSWSATVESLFGLDDDFGGTFESFVARLHPDDAAEFQAVLAEVMSGRQIQYTVRHRIIRGDGAVRWLEGTGRSWRGPAGQLARITGTVVDITDRREVIEALAASEARFRLAMESSAIGMALVALDGRWIEVNPALCRIFGFERAEFLVTDFQALTHPDDLTPDLALVQRLLAGEIATYEMEKRYFHKSGELIFAQLNVTLARAGDGTPLHFISQIQDIGERRRIEEQLRQSQKMEAVGQLAGGVAHDFNNVLAAIMMQAELAGLQPGLPQTVVELLSDIQGAAARAASLTRQLLQFSRQEVLQPRHLDLNESVRNLERMLARVLRSDVQIRLELANGALWVHADPGMVDQILMNLAVNARDAMPGGGTLTIRTGLVRVRPHEPPPAANLLPGEYVRMVVADQGTGISPENLPRIFEPFFTTKGPGKGTGLGLPTVFGIVQQHRGGIAVNSRLGVGTIFEVYLPVSDPDLASDTGPIHARAALRGRETVLLVEDDPMLGPLSRTVLEGWGYRVLLGRDATEGERLFAENAADVDLLITDLVMPGVQGRDLAESLRNKAPDLKVLMTSGYSPELAGRHLRLGPGQAFLPKPYGPEELGLAVRACLDGDEGPPAR